MGSVKGFFEDKDIDSFKNLNIVPSHPIAGTELSGAKNAFSTTGTKPRRGNNRKKGSV